VRNKWSTNEYFSTHFTQEYPKGHMHEEHTNLLIKAGNRPAIVIARLIIQSQEAGLSSLTSQI
uniref:Uncharacterized protein n=1 Tax=Aegilops tauschii subsp. strangulata TaxID=200361 RepID=A0A453CEH4_AEGTS